MNTSRIWFPGLPRGLFRRLAFALLVGCGVMQAPDVRAQWAVIDVKSIAQLTQQVKTLTQTLEVARNQLSQAQSQYQSLTGTRGLQNLLSDTVRNYLPSDVGELASVLQGGGADSGLTALVQATAQARAILGADQLAQLPPQERQLLLEARNTAALLQGLSGSALSNSSGRFSSLQQLISAIGTVTDPKAVMDLQARIGAEQAMLQNEHTKLQTLYQAAEASRWSDAQRVREQVVAGHGSFDTRFQPAP